MIIRPVVLAGPYRRPAGLEPSAATVNTNGLLQAVSHRFARGGSRKPDPADAHHSLCTRGGAGCSEDITGDAKLVVGSGSTRWVAETFPPPEFASNICK